MAYNRRTANEITWTDPESGFSESTQSLSSIQCIDFGGCGGSSLVYKFLHVSSCFFLSIFFISMNTQCYLLMTFLQYTIPTDMTNILLFNSPPQFVSVQLTWRAAVPQFTPVSVYMILMFYLWEQRFNAFVHHLRFENIRFPHNHRK